MNIDEILATTSKENFHGLEFGQQRILAILAKKESLNLKELGKLTSQGRTITGFDRWGCKKRLEGTFRFSGLVPNDYVLKIRRNKKETRYRLTIKGFLACLSFLKFEEIYLIDRYTKILSKYTNDRNKVENILNYMKYEITYLLYFNYIQGINWLKFRFLKQYIEKQRVHDEKGNFNLYFEIDKSLINKKQRLIFECLQRQYGKSYMQARFFSMSYVAPEKVYNSWLKKLTTKKEFNTKIRETLGLYLYGRFWHELIDSPKKEMSDSALVGNYLEVEDFDFRPHILKMSKKELESVFGHKVN